MLDNTTSHNISKVMTELIDRNIIYVIQYISNDDTQVDSGGPQSCYNITILCIEKTANDYIFHFYYSDYIHSYSYPSIICVDKFTKSSKKLSDLINDINTIKGKSTYYIDNFIKHWENDYCKVIEVSDEKLKSEMMKLHSKIDEIEKEIN